MNCLAPCASLLLFSILQAVSYSNLILLHFHAHAVFSHVFFNLTHICNILGSDVIKSHQMVLLEMVLLILFKLTYLRPVPS